MELNMKKLRLLAATVAMGMAAAGCATSTNLSAPTRKKCVPRYVQDQLKSIEDRLSALEQRTGAIDDNLRSLGERLDQAEASLNAHEERIAAVSKTAQEALDQTAQEALDQIAQGALDSLDRANAASTSGDKLLYQVVMTDDTLRFAPDSAELSEEAKAALDEFAARIKAEGKPVFIEIHGHTDSRGPADYNQRLGLMRAEAVRSYLHRKGGLPLARMSVISYGESEPVADNRTREGRMQNRRVVLVVLQ